MSRWLRGNGAFFCLGLLTSVGYWFAAFGWEFLSSQRDVLRFLALFSVQFLWFGLAWLWLKSGREANRAASVAVILVWAGWFRLIMLFAGLPLDQPLSMARADLAGEAVAYQRFLLYDHDVWRYLWDGHVSALAGDPYRATPEHWWHQAENGDVQAQALFVDEVWEDVFDFLGYADHLTVYPPLAQAYFRFCHAMAPGSVLFHKAAIAALDMAVCGLLVLALGALKRPRETVLLYAWNPLIIKEFAGSGHLDPLMLVCLAAAVLLTLRQYHRTAMVCFGGAVLAKLAPVILLPLFLRRWPWRWWWVAAVPLIVGYGYYAESLAPMLSGIGTFASDWVFNPGPWGLMNALAGLAHLPEMAVTIAAGGILAICIWICMAWDRGDGRSLALGGFVIMASALLLSPAVMPWYLSWALLLGVLAGNRTWLLLMFLAMGSYLIYIDQSVRIWWLWVEYTMFFAAVIWFDLPPLWQKIHSQGTCKLG